MSSSNQTAMDSAGPWPLPRTPDGGYLDLSGPPTRVEGAPAIQPTVSAAAQSTTTPAFTEADVKAYFAAQQSLGKILPLGAPPQVAKVEFMTAQELDNLLDVNMGRPATDLLCYVTLHGTFQLPSGPPSLQGRAAVRSVDRVHAVFDAHTGNLLLVGTGPSDHQ